MRKSLITLAAFSVSLSSCGEKAPSPSASSEAEAKDLAATSNATSAPTHNYDDEEAGTYFYVAAVSEEDRKKGKVAGDVVGFQYIGKNDKNQNMIRSISEDGSTISKAYCSDPCRIIRYSDGERVAFNPESIIGAAFQDVMNGFLRPMTSKPVAERAAYPRTSSSIPSAFNGAWDELTQDGCANREARFVFDSNKFYNFEVEWDVTKVVLYSPTEMDLHTATRDENGSQVSEVWEFKLADGGKSVTSRKAGGEFFRRCRG